MKKKLVLSVMFAALLAAGLALVSCEFGTKASGGGGGSYPQTSGRLTITGLDAYNGKWVSAAYTDWDADFSLEAFADVDIKKGVIKGVKITNGKATLKVWKINNSLQNPEVINYTGSDDAEFNVLVLNKEVLSEDDDFDNFIVARGIVDVRFYLGIGEGAFISYEDWNYPQTNGRLTVTGLDTYNGKWVIAGYDDLQTDFHLEAFDDVDVKREVIRAAAITNGRATLKVWVSEHHRLPAGYAGNDTVDFEVAVVNKGTLHEDDLAGESLYVAAGTARVRFTSGIGEGAFASSEGEEPDPEDENPEEEDEDPEDEETNPEDED